MLIRRALQFQPMKLPFLPTLVASLTLMAAIAQPGRTQSSNRYFCAVLDGTPRTFVQTSRGNIAIISWVTQLSREWTPIRRCVEVSNRFQRFADNGVLRQIATGTVNGQSVLCAVAARGDVCNERNILITLPPDRDRYEVARQLLDIRALAAGRTVILSGDEKIVTYQDGEEYYDLEILLEVASTTDSPLTPVEEDSPVAN